MRYDNKLVRTDDGVDPRNIYLSSTALATMAAAEPEPTAAEYVLERGIEDRQLRPIVLQCLWVPC